MPDWLLITPTAHAGARAAASSASPRAVDRAAPGRDRRCRARRARACRPGRTAPRRPARGHGRCRRRCRAAAPRSRCQTAANGMTSAGRRHPAAPRPRRWSPGRGPGSRRRRTEVGGQRRPAGRDAGGRRGRRPSAAAAAAAAVPTVATCQRNRPRPGAARARASPGPCSARISASSALPACIRTADPVVRRPHRVRRSAGCPRDQSPAGRAAPAAPRSASSR